MRRPLMHLGQVTAEPGVVGDLVARQFPGLAGSTISPVPSNGTVNALYRVGRDAVARLPLVPDPSPAGRAALEAELAAVALVEGRLPVETPRPLGLGQPDAGYDGWWSLYAWIDGDAVDTLDTGQLSWRQLAQDLAGLILALRSLPVDRPPCAPNTRGGDLAAFDDHFTTYLPTLGALANSVERAWARVRDQPAADATTWVHADLMPGNLLTRDGRLAALLDWELLRVGDPAVDLMPAWNLFDAEARDVFRGEVQATDAEWERGRGWAIVQAVPALAYYRDSNPVMSQTARRTLTAAAQ